MFKRQVEIQKHKAIDAEFQFNATFSELMNVKKEIFGEVSNEEENNRGNQPEYYDPQADLEKERGPHYKTKNAGVMRYFTLDKAE